MTVKVLSQLSLDTAQGGVDLLDLVVEHEVLLFYETHLHKNSLVTSLESRVRLDQVFKLED